MSKEKVEEVVGKLDTSKIIKKYGDVIYDTSLILDNPKKVISVSPKLDIALGGGVPEGVWFTLTGAPKCGKTVMALTFAASAQKIGKKVYYGNIEHRLKKRDLLGIAGLDLSPEKFQVIGSTKEKILTGQDFLQIFDTILKSEDDVVLILDSTGDLSTDAEMTGSMEEMQRADVPKLLAKFVRKNTATVGIRNSIVINITHLSANVSGMGPQFSETGGTKMQYQSDSKVRAKSVNKWEEKDVQVGQIVKWHVIWSALGPPGPEVESYIRYGIGIDKVQEILSLGVETGFIEQKGAWYNFSGEKFQGEPKLAQYLRDHPDKCEELNQQIRTMYGIDQINEI